MSDDLKHRVHQAREALAAGDEAVIAFLRGEDEIKRLRGILAEIRDLPHGERDEAVCAICVAVNRGLNPAEATGHSSR